MSSNDPRKVQGAPAREPHPRTQSESDLLAALLKEVVPERHISEDLVAGFLDTYRRGGDVTRYLLDCAAGLLRSLDADLNATEEGAEQLRREVRALDRVSRDLKSSFHELALIDEIVCAEQGRRSLRDVLESYMDLLARLLPLPAIRVYLINPETRAFEAAAGRGLRSAQEREAEVRLEEGTFAWALREGGPIVTPVRMPPGEGRTLVVAPMSLAGQPLGVTCLFSALQDAEYTPQHFQLLRSLVGRAALSIENARRVQALETESRRLTAMRDYLGRIVDNLVQGILVIGPDDTVTIFNRTAEIVFGEAREDVVGRHYDAVLPPDLVKLLRSLLVRARRDDLVVDYEFDFDRGEGVTFRLGVTDAVLRDPEGAGGGVVFTFRDLFSARELMRLRQSDRFKTHAIDRFRESLRRTEEQLRRSEKLASIGQMAAGVAHEINNPLGSLAGFIQILQMDMPAEDENREYLDAMQREVQRMKGIVESLLDFSRQQPEERQSFLPVDVNLVVQETLRLVEPQARISRAEVRPALAPELPRIHGLADRLKQVFMNIALNAFFAMNKDENLLDVQTRLVHDAEGAPWVHVAFTDNGEGIRQEDLTRIFDPFFTTREQGKGTGLGLATCFGIVEQHGGGILVDSTWGEGSTFTVRLPVPAEPPAEEADASAVPYALSAPLVTDAAVGPDGNDDPGGLAGVGGMDGSATPAGMTDGSGPNAPVDRDGAAGSDGRPAGVEAERPPADT
ncbi:MAG: ATP-binding protein [Planctomycetota bacterium]